MNVITVFLRFLKCLLGNVIYLIALFIPKNNSLWIFGSWWGTQYADNPKYFFEYVRANYPDIRAVWLASNKNLINQLRQNGVEAYSTYSLQGLWVCLRAKVAVVSHFRLTDINPLVLPRKTILVQLTHGIPLKKIGYDDDIFTNRNTLLYKIRNKADIINRTATRGYEMVCVTSQEMIDRFSSVFNLSKAKIKVTGYPRNDVIFKQTNSFTHNGPVGIYMPTFRGEIGSTCRLFDSYGFDLGKIDTFCRQHNIILYLKLHPANKPKAEDLAAFQQATNIRFYDKPDVYPDLNSFSFLITDYSSIFFDYLLLDRPIIFSPFDIEQYMKNERNFYYGYDAVTPGPKARNWDEVLRLISESLQKPSQHQDRRKEICDRFHQYKDGNSSQRIYNLIQDYLKTL